jgi:hypothetical protein
MMMTIVLARQKKAPAGQAEALQTSAACEIFSGRGNAFGPSIGWIQNQLASSLGSSFRDPE